MFFSGNGALPFLPVDYYVKLSCTLHSSCSVMPGRRSTTSPPSSIHRCTQSSEFIHHSWSWILNRYIGILSLSSYIASVAHRWTPNWLVIRINVYLPDGITSVWEVRDVNCCRVIVSRVSSFISCPKLLSPCHLAVVCLEMGEVKICIEAQIMEWILSKTNFLYIPVCHEPIFYCHWWTLKYSTT